jgi:hypothetical protein
MRFGNGLSVYEMDRYFRSMKKALLTIRQDLMRTVSNIDGTDGMEPDSLGKTTIRLIGCIRVART